MYRKRKVNVSGVFWNILRVFFLETVIFGKTLVIVVFYFSMIWNMLRLFYVNTHKTEYMCYNQTGDISTLDGTPLKLVDLPRKQRRINRKGHRYEVNESMDSYR